MPRSTRLNSSSLVRSALLFSQLYNAWVAVHFQAEVQAIQPKIYNVTCNYMPCCFFVCYSQVTVTLIMCNSISNSLVKVDYPVVNASLKFVITWNGLEKSLNLLSKILCEPWYLINRNVLFQQAMFCWTDGVLLCYTSIHEDRHIVWSNLIGHTIHVHVLAAWLYDSIQNRPFHVL